MASENYIGNLYLRCDFRTKSQAKELLNFFVNADLLDNDGGVRECIGRTTLALALVVGVSV